MYLHIGNGVSVRTREVIALCDCSLFLPAPGGKKKQVSANYDLMVAAGGKVVSCTEGQEEPKTLVITDRGLYLSPVSAPTLRRRQQMVLKKR